MGFGECTEFGGQGRGQREDLPGTDVQMLRRSHVESRSEQSSRMAGGTLLSWDCDVMAGTGDTELGLRSLCLVPWLAAQAGGTEIDRGAGA